MPALSIACANSISITMYLHREQLKINTLLKIEKQKNTKVKRSTPCFPSSKI